MRLLLPQGIGDSIWALHKAESVAKMEGDGVVEVFLNCSEDNYIQARALQFIKRFKCVSSAKMLVVSIHPPMNIPVDAFGRYIYIDDGWFCKGFDSYFALMPNGPLERGIRLEDWLPKYPVNWDLPSQFQFTQEEGAKADLFRERIGKYCVFYLGSLNGNTKNGHNRGPRWKPEDWVNIAERFQKEFGLGIVVVGADYDETYYEVLVKHRIDDPWHDFIGRCTIADTFALVKRANFVLSFQSGIGIFASYLGVPTGIFWRAKGDSISPDFYLSFEEEMASAWVRPDMLEQKKHLPLIYGRHGVDYIVEEMRKRKWL